MKWSWLGDTTMFRQTHALNFVSQIPPKKSPHFGGEGQTWPPWHQVWNGPGGSSPPNQSFPGQGGEFIVISPRVEQDESWRLNGYWMDTFISIFHHHFSVDLMILMVMNHVFILFSWNLCMGILYNWINIGMSVTRVLNGGISGNPRWASFERNSENTELGGFSRTPCLMTPEASRGYWFLSNQSAEKN